MAAQRYDSLLKMTSSQCGYNHNTLRCGVTVAKRLGPIRNVLLSPRLNHTRRIIVQKNRGKFFSYIAITLNQIQTNSQGALVQAPYPPVGSPLQNEKRKNGSRKETKSHGVCFVPWVP